MSNAAKHRKKAAEFEQLKQIDRAIASYVKAIEESESSGEDVDVALLNKVGDLALRQGRVPDAVTYYERAVEHYATSGLFNNAIALCNKILRNAPGRANVYFTLGRICARKGLKGDATRNFLEYATRMQQDGRVDEGMRALAEVADLTPELIEVRRLVDEHATRAGIVLPRRGTPAHGAGVLTEDVAPANSWDRSQDLVFLEVDYGGRPPRRTPVGAPRTPTPAFTPRVSTPHIAPTVIDPLASVGPPLEAFLLFDPATDLAEPAAPAVDGLEANADFADRGTPPLDGLEYDPDLVWPDLVFDEPHNADVPPTASILPDLRPSTPPPPIAELLIEDFEHPESEPAVLEIIATRSYTPPIVPAIVQGDARDVAPLADLTSVPELEAAIAAGAELVADAETADRSDRFRAETPDIARPSFRLDPHNFILAGELPPLLLDDALVDHGFARAREALSYREEASLTAHSRATVEDSEPAPPAAVALASAVETLEAEGALSETEGSAEYPADRADDAADGLSPWVASGRAAEIVRSMSVTPSLPIAAVAAEAVLVAGSRRDAMRAQVAASPHDWMLRRRLAEALFEAGERDAALQELETAQRGLVDAGDLLGGCEIADELVLVSPERVPYHQKRVELAVRLQDQQRLRRVYLDLADALGRLGEESRARAVYARVLEIDPWDDRARAALGAAAPPPPPPKKGSDAGFVDLAGWLQDTEGPATTRMRMREPTISGDEQADFNALLRHFKEGVARSLEEDDFESRYDLGVAYKEMGLLDDAISEFQKALRSRSHRLAAYEALGQCFVEQGSHQVAATVLTRALHEPGLDDEQRVGVLYLLAYSCEALQQFDDARTYYQRVFATDIHFRDVAARLAALDQTAR